MADVKFLSNLVVDGNIDLTAGGGYQIKNATFESLTTDPTSNNFEGRMIYRSDTNQVRFYNGSAWASIAGDITGVTAGSGLGGGGTSGAVTLSVNVDGTTTQIVSDNIVARTAAVAAGGESLATGDQISSFVTGQGYITGNQTITLSGDVTGSGTTAITTTIAANAVEASMLNNNIISGKTALTTGLASTDELLVSDAGTVKRMDVSVLETYMQNNLTFTTNTDVDVSAANLLARLDDISSNITLGSGSSVHTATSGNLTVGGNLIVEGTTTTVNSTTVAIDDHHMKVATDNSTTNDFGFYGRYNSTAAYAGLFFDVSTEEWKFYANNGTEPGNTTFTPDELATIKAAGFVGELTGNASTASSAAKWTNARTITLGGDLTGNVSIDGSANATLTATIAANSVALGTDTTGNYVASVTTSGALNGSASSEGAALALTVDSATTGQVGVVELATSAEALAGSATDKAVTPSGLAARSYTESIGDGTATSFTVTHGLGTRNVMVQMYDASSYETVYAEVSRTSTTALTVTFNTAPAANDITVLVTKVD